MNSAAAFTVAADEGPRTKSQRIPTAEDEAASGAYWMNGAGSSLGFPAVAFRKAIISAAKGRKVGRLGLPGIVMSAVFETTELLPLHDPDTGETLAEYEIDVRGARPRRGRGWSAGPGRSCTRGGRRSTSRVRRRDGHAGPHRRAARRRRDAMRNRKIQEPEKGGRYGRFRGHRESPLITFTASSVAALRGATLRRARRRNASHRTVPRIASPRLATLGCARIASRGGASQRTAPFAAAPCSASHRFARRSAPRSARLRIAPFVAPLRAAALEGSTMTDPDRDPMIDMWERGVTLPTEEQLARLIELLRLPERGDLGAVAGGGRRGRGGRASAGLAPGEEASSGRGDGLALGDQAAALGFEAGEGFDGKPSIEADLQVAVEREVDRVGRDRRREARGPMPVHHRGEVQEPRGPAIRPGSGQLADLLDLPPAGSPA